MNSYVSDLEAVGTTISYRPSIQNHTAFANPQIVFPTSDEFLVARKARVITINNYFLN